MSASTIAKSPAARLTARAAIRPCRKSIAAWCAKASSIAAAHGYPLGDRMDPDKMLARLLHHTPSLLQDYMKPAGRWRSM